MKTKYEKELLCKNSKNAFKRYFCEVGHEILIIKIRLNQMPQREPEFKEIREFLFLISIFRIFEYYDFWKLSTQNIMGLINQ